MAGTVVIFSGGAAPRASAASLVPAGSSVVAADRGVDHALALGIVPDLAVGDFDSVSASGLERVVDAGGEVQRHRPDKDATDLELALDAGLDRSAERLIVIGGDAGRLDHLLASVAVLARPRHAGLRVEAHLGDHRVDVVHPGQRTALSGAPGVLVTLLAHGGPATGVTTTGLRFALADAVLDPWSSLGVSNEFAEATASVTIASGVVLAITPGPEQEER